MADFRLLEDGTSKRLLENGADKRILESAAFAAAVSGTAVASITETDVITGGKTIVITLTGGAEWIT